MCLVKSMLQTMARFIVISRRCEPRRDGTHYEHSQVILYTPNEQARSQSPGEAQRDVKLPRDQNYCAEDGSSDANDQK